MALSRWSLSAVVLVVVGGGCGGGGDDGGPGTCLDGIRNGDETDVDCGASCGVGCAITGACATGADCAFASCAGGVCVAPTEGPAPTGAVTATIDPAGTTIDFVSDEHVAVELVVPPGAVDHPVDVAITPHTPTRAGEWLSPEVSIGGLIFRVPATQRVTLPPGVTPTDGYAAAYSSTGVDQYLVPTVIDPAARTLSADLTFLGNPASAPAYSALGPIAGKRAQLDYWDHMVIAASSYPLATIVPILQSLADAVSREGRFDDAAGLRRVISALYTRGVNLESEPQILAALRSIKASSCAGLGTALAALDAGQPARCNWQAVGAVEPVLCYEQMVQAVGTAVGTTCEFEGDYTTKVGRKLQEAIDNEDADVVDFERCECERPLRDGEDRPKKCMAFMAPSHDAPAPAFAAGFVAMPDDWDLIARVTEAARATYDPLYTIDLPTQAAMFDSQLSDAEIATARRFGYESCQGDRDMSYLDVLARVVPDPSAIEDDVDHCASTLAIDSVDATSAPVDSQTLAPGAGPGTSLTETTVGADADGTIHLRGPIATRICRTGDLATSTREDETLTLSAQAGAGRVELGTRQANGAADVITAIDGFDVDVATTRTALGLATDDPFDLVVERTSTACATSTTIGPDELFRVHVTKPQLRVTILTQAEGTFARATIEDETGPTCPIHAFDQTGPAAEAPPPLTVTAVATANQQITGSVTMPDPMTIAVDADFQESHPPGTDCAGGVAVSFALRVQVPTDVTLTVDSAPGWVTASGSPELGEGVYSQALYYLAAGGPLVVAMNYWYVDNMGGSNETPISTSQALPAGDYIFRLVPGSSTSGSTGTGRVLTLHFTP